MAYLAKEASGVAGSDGAALEKHVGALEVGVQQADGVQVAHASAHVYQAQQHRHLHTRP